MRIEVDRSTGRVDLLSVPIADAKLLLAMRQVSRSRIKSLLEFGGEVPTRKPDPTAAAVVAQFICRSPIPVGEQIAFGDYFARFVAWLGEDDRNRGRWCRRKFRQGLPDDYVSLPGSGNQKFIHRLAEPPGGPYASTREPPWLSWSIDAASHLPAAPASRTDGSYSPRQMSDAL